jgi:hypothetical protein
MAARGETIDVIARLGITHEDVAVYLRSLTAGDYYGPREKWPAYLAYRPDERLFFNAYTFEQPRSSWIHFA